MNFRYGCESGGNPDNMRGEIHTTEAQAQPVAAELSALAGQLTRAGNVVAIESVPQLLNVRKLDA